MGDCKDFLSHWNCDSLVLKTIESAHEESEEWGVSLIELEVNGGVEMAVSNMRDLATNIVAGNNNRA